RVLFGRCQTESWRWISRRGKRRGSLKQNPSPATIPAMRPLVDQRVTVMGLGRFGGGIAVARWLVEQGARVLVTDKEPAGALADSVTQLGGLPIEYRLGEHRDADFAGADLVVASPAVALGNPHLLAARAAGVPVTTEICLFVERCPARTICG